MFRRWFSNLWKGSSTISASRSRLRVAHKIFKKQNLVFDTLEARDVPATLLGWDTSPLPGGTNNFGPSPYAPTTTDPSVTSVVGLTRGAAVSTTGTGASRAWGGVDWQSLDAAAAVAANKTFTFSFVVAPSTTVSLNSLTHSYRRSGTGPASGQWSYQINSGAFTNVGAVQSYTNTTSSGATLPALSLAGESSLQNLAAGTQVTIRLAAFGGTSNSGTFYVFDVANTTAPDLILDGTASPAAPAPVFTSSNLMTVVAGNTLTTPVTATNGPNTYTITGGDSLAGSGLSLNSNGTWSGSAAQGSGQAFYNVIVTANNGQTATQNLRISVAAATPNDLAYIATTSGASAYQLPTPASGAAIIDPGLVMFGPAATVTAVRVTATAFLANDQMAFNGQFGTVNYSAGGGKFFRVDGGNNQVDITSTDSGFVNPVPVPLADMQAALRLVGFFNNTAGSSTATRTFEFRVLDVANPATPRPTKSISVTAVTGALLSVSADASASATEGPAGTKQFTFTVTRSGLTTGTTTVDWAASSGTGTNTATAADFQGGVFGSGTVSFADGETTKPIVVTVLGDAVAEFDETFLITLSNPIPGTATITGPTATGTILNDDTITASISAITVDKTEGNSGSKVFTFQVNRTGDTNSTTTLNWSVPAGAANATDFQGGVLPSGSISFASGEMQKDILVNVAGDTTFEPDESFSVVLTDPGGSNPTTITLSPGSVSDTIQNDDTQVTVGSSPGSVNENTGTLSYTFNRAGPTASALVLNFTTTGSAVFGAGADYTASAPAAANLNFAGGQVTIPAGQGSVTITITPVNDTTSEATEDVVLTVAANGSLYSIGSPSALTGTIVDDDLPEINVAVSPATMAEDAAGTITFTFTRTGVFTSALPVQFTSASLSSAAAGSDFSVTSPDAAAFNYAAGTLTFAAGSGTATVVVDPTADATVELNETVRIQLNTGSGYVLGPNNDRTGTINNDDTDVTVAIGATTIVDENGLPNLLYTFHRNGVTATPLTINFTVGGTALISDSDYTASAPAGNSLNYGAGTLVFQAGESDVVVTIDPTGDATFENDETVVLSMATGANYNIPGGASSASGTIRNDDLPTVTLGVSPSSTPESGANLVYTFTRTGPTTSTLVVNFSGAGGTATIGAGNDYVTVGSGFTFDGTTGTVTFAAGSATALVTIDPVDDSVFEADETVSLTIQTNPATYNVGTAGAVVGTITNDDTRVSVSLAAPTSVMENSTGLLVYTFLREGPTGSPLTINFTATGTAGVTGDYTTAVTPPASLSFGASGTVTIPAGQTQAVVTIDPTDEGLFEDDETVILTVVAAAGYSVTGTPATGTIQNDDKPTVTLAVTGAASMLENDPGTLTYTFNRSGSLTNSLTVSFSIGGTVDGSDYSVSGPPGLVYGTTSGTITFAAGSANAVLTIDPTGDTTPESHEQLQLTLTAGSGNYIIGTATAQAVTITNDDPSAITVTVAPSSVLENHPTDTLLYTFTRNGTFDNPLPINFTVGGSASVSSDYTASSSQVFNFAAGTITIPVGQPSATITIDPTGDTTPEGNETVDLTVISGPNYTVAATNFSASGTILDDDNSDVSVAVSPGLVAENGVTNLVYTFTRNGLTTTNLTVNFNIGTGAGSATFNTDYTVSGAATYNGTIGSVVIPAGFTSAAITIDPTGDTTAEGDETVALTVVGNAQYNAGTPATATGTIDNDDPSDVSITVSANVFEDGSTNLTYTFTRNGTFDNDLPVNFSVAGSATLGAGADYTASSSQPLTFGATNGTVTIAAGQPSVTIVVDPVADTTPEGHETVILTVTSGTGYNVATPAASATATGTITNDDFQVSVAVSADVSEDGAPNLTYTFTRTGTFDTVLAINFSVAGSATLNTDYVATGATTFTASSGTLSFPVGIQTVQVIVNPTADTTVETDETVIIGVTAGTGYTPTGSAVTGTITNDDATVSVGVSPLSTAEDGPTDLVYTFTRVGYLGSVLPVNFTVGSGAGSATFGTDYTVTGATSFTAAAGSVTFAANSDTVIVTVNPTADTTVEGNETVGLTVVSGTGYTATGSPATGTITNDDTDVSVAIISPAPTAVNEDLATNLVYTFTRTGVTTNVLTVNFTVGGSATLGGDYAASGAATFTATSGTVTFPANVTTVTVTVDPVADTVVEPSETVILTMDVGSGYTPTGTQATGTITNDDATTLAIVATNAVQQEGNSGVKQFTFTVTRSGDLSSPTTVNYAVTGGTTFPADAADFGGSFPSGPLSFAINETFKVISVPVSGDTTAENDESFVVTLSGASSPATITTASANGLIQNDDVATIVTTTALTVTQAGPSTGYVVNLSAVVTPTPSGPPPLTVTFKNGNNVIATVPLTGNTASVSNVVVAAGSNVLTATFSGNALYLGSTGSATYTPGKYSTTTTLATSSATAAVGVPVTFTATTTSPNGMPEGTVVFFRNGSAISGAVALVNGRATFTTSTLPVGANTMTAVYSGNAAYSTSDNNSNPITQTIGGTVNTGNLASNIGYTTSGKAVSTVVIRNKSTTDTLAGGFILELPTIGGTVNYSLTSAYLYVNGVRSGPLTIDTTSLANTPRIRIPSTVPPGSTLPYPVVTSLAPNAIITLELNFATGTTPLTQASTVNWKLYFGQ